MAGVTKVANDQALKNLAKIDHIVVLMMENRSFDHMLGFLTVDEGRTDVEGLKGTESNITDIGVSTVHPATLTTLVKRQDPRHGYADVAEQIADGTMGGFAQNYWSTRDQPPFQHDTPGTVMAYHTARQLPVYAFLAEQFCVCDHWFCSLPGETTPNRAYAVGGSSGDGVEALNPPRPYNLSAFTRHLDKAKV